MRGRLRIFLGYAPGVGKTRAMLDAGQQRQSEGLDVVIGCIDPDADPSFLQHFEILPSQTQSVQIDAILKRRPALVLIDNLAAPNPTGAAHPYRYQDVDELLEAGIDVYATLNLQHIESLNDIIFQITGLKEVHTVPDAFLAQADEIKAIDVPIEDLLQRYNAGQIVVTSVYKEGKLFRRGNLIALRELALRYVARHIDRDMQAYMKQEAIRGPWAAAEKLMVAVGPSPLSARLVRATCRLSQDLNAEWHAVYVESMLSTGLDDAARERLAQNMHLAEQLGAKVVTVSGSGVASALLQYARDNNVTKIIIGHPRHARLIELVRGSIVNKLVKNSGGIDIYVISSGDSTPLPTIELDRPTTIDLKKFLAVSVWIGLATILGLILQTVVSPVNMVMLYLLVVMLAAVRLGYVSAVFASLVSVLALNYFFVPPRLTLHVGDAEYLLTLAGLLIVSFVIANLTERLRLQAELAHRRELQTAELYSLSSDLSATVDPTEIMHAILKHAQKTFRADAAILLNHDDDLVVVLHTDGYNFQQEELTAARWARDHTKSAGIGTDNMPSAPAIYLPMYTAEDMIGVLAIRADEQMYYRPEQRRLMEAFANQAALALEATRLADQARQAQLLKAREQLQNTLLNSISHDLRTPLVSITGTLSSLRDDSVYFDDAARNDLLDGAYQEANRLNRLVGNLLELNRLESGTINLKRDLFDVTDIIGVARAQLNERLKNRQIIVKLPQQLPMVPVDLVLMGQVLVNLIDNAVKYSPPDQPIEIEASADAQMLTLTVSDRGIGIPSSELPNIFEKFYRSFNTGGASGTGLGLSICQGIVEVHGGQIQVENRPEGGASFHVMLPLHVEPDR